MRLLPWELWFSLCCGERSIWKVVEIACDEAATLLLTTVVIMEGMFMRGMVIYPAFVDTMMHVVGSRTLRPVLA